MTQITARTALKQTGPCEFEVYWKGQYYGTYSVVIALAKCTELEQFD